MVVRRRAVPGYVVKSLIWEKTWFLAAVEAASMLVDGGRVGVHEEGRPRRQPGDQLSATPNFFQPKFSEPANCSTQLSSHNQHHSLLGLGPITI